jgi:hypothetical protein
MTLASEVETVGALLKKYYESGPAKKQFFDDPDILRRVQKNRRDAKAGHAVIGLHTTRNPGIGAAANGAALPAAGKQGYNQATVPMKYVYGVTQFTGVDIANSRNNAAAFANVMTANMDGLITDMKADVNRQLFADGSGILALAAGDQSSTVTAIYPYLWADADKYLQTVGMRVEVYALTDFSTSNVTTASYVLSTAGTAHTNMYTTSGGIGTSTAGDIIGRYGSLQLANATDITQYEMMGIDGIVGRDLVGDSSYSYDYGDETGTAVINFTGPEGQAYDYRGPGSASNNNVLQSIDAASNAFWRSKIWANGGAPRAITFTLLDDAIGYLRTVQGSKLSVLWTTYKVRQAIMDLIREDRRYVDSMEVDAAVRVPSYDGIPMLVSGDCPRGRIYLLDESELTFYIQDDFQFIVDGKGNNLFWQAGYDGYTVTGKVYANLGTSSRHRHGKIIDILES